MKLSVERETARVPVAVIRLEGELDASNYLEVIELAREVAAGGTSHVLIDLGGMTYMGSSGLFALHSVAMLLRGEQPPDPEAGWGAIHSLDRPQSDTIENVKLLEPQPQVERVLERTGLTRFFEVHTDRAAALASF